MKLHFKSLLPSIQRLVRLIKEIQHGQILGLPIRNGEPQFSSPTTVVKVHKAGQKSYKVKRPAHDDLELMTQVRHLCQCIQELGNGTLYIDVRDGLPFVFGEISSLGVLAV